MTTTVMTSRVTFRFARMVSGRERNDELEALELLAMELPCGEFSILLAENVILGSRNSHKNMEK